MVMHKLSLALTLLGLAASVQAKTPHFLFVGQSNMEGVLNESRFNVTLDTLLESNNDTFVQQELVSWLSTFDSRPETSLARYEFEAAELVRLKNSGLLTTNFREPLSTVGCSFYMLDFQINYRTNLNLQPNVRARDAALSPYSQCGSPFGPELTFGHSMMSSSNISIVKFASGGSEIVKHWSKETGYFWLELVEVVEAINPMEEEWTGIVWFQGENDAFENTTVQSQNADSYLQDLTRFVADLRESMFQVDTTAFTSAADIPVAIVGVGCWTTGVARLGPVIVQAQLDFVASDSNAVHVKTNDLSCHFHYDGASQVIIGARVAEAMQTLLPQDVVTDTPSASPSIGNRGGENIEGVNTPSAAPSASKLPSMNPTSQPSGAAVATDAPSSEPSNSTPLPSQEPTLGMAATDAPSTKPSTSDDNLPTQEPTFSGNNLPSQGPLTSQPSLRSAPSTTPEGPTQEQTFQPATPKPADDRPSMQPSNAPSKSPKPSNAPTDSTSSPTTEVPSFSVEEDEPSASNAPSPDVFQALCTPLSDSSNTTSCPAGEGNPVCTPYRSPDHCPAENSFPMLIMQRERLVNENLADLENEGYWFQYLDDVGAGYAFSRSNGVPAPKVYCCTDSIDDLATCFDTPDSPTTSFVIRASNLHSNLGTFVLPAGFGGVEMLRGVPMDFDDVMAYLLALETAPSRLVVEEFISGSTSTPTLPNEYKFHMFNGEVGSVNGFLNRGTVCACYTEVSETFERLDQYGCFTPSAPSGLNGDNDMCYDIDFAMGERNPYQLKGFDMCGAVDKPEACVWNELLRYAKLLSSEIGVYMASIFSSRTTSASTYKSTLAITMEDYDTVRRG